MRRLYRAGVFFFFLFVFTVFFQGQTERWLSLGDPDRQGAIWRYEARGVRRAGPGCFEVSIERRLGDVRSQQRFRVDINARTIENLSQRTPPEFIPPGSAADILVRRLRENT